MPPRRCVRMASQLTKPPPPPYSPDWSAPRRGSSSISAPTPVFLPYTSGLLSKNSSVNWSGSDWRDSWVVAKRSKTAMTVKITRLELTASDLRGAAGRTKDADAARRMLATPGSSPTSTPAAECPMTDDRPWQCAAARTRAARSSRPKRPDQPDRDALAHVFQRTHGGLACVPPGSIVRPTRISQQLYRAPRVQLAFRPKSTGRSPPLAKEHARGPAGRLVTKRAGAVQPCIHYILRAIIWFSRLRKYPCSIRLSREQRLSGQLLKLSRLPWIRFTNSETARAPREIGSGPMCGKRHKRENIS